MDPEERPDVVGCPQRHTAQITKLRKATKMAVTARKFVTHLALCEAILASSSALYLTPLLTRGNGSSGTGLSRKSHNGFLIQVSAGRYLSGALYEVLLTSHLPPSNPAMTPAAADFPASQSAHDTLVVRFV